MKKAFTLIELLVVIAIIAIVTAMLLPVVITAKNRIKGEAAPLQIREVQPVTPITPVESPKPLVIIINGTNVNINGTNVIQ